MKKVVLIIDDNSDILDLFEIYLYKEYDVITAHNGFDGLTAAQKRQPHCVITDIMMPVMDGIKFISRFYKYEEFQNIPVIAITAFTATLQEEGLRNAGFAAVTSKPIGRQELLDLVAKVINASALSGSGKNQ